MKNLEIAPAKGKLGILLVGLGAVSTTTIAGVLAIRKGLANPIGSLTQMGTIRLGKRTEGRSPKISEAVPLVNLDNVVFGGWDIFEENSYQAARTAGVLETSLLDQIKPDLEAIKPMTAVFDQRYVKRLDGPNVKKGKNKKDLAEQLRADIRAFKKDNSLDRLVMVWCGSTEVFMKESAAHQSIDAFEKALEANDPAIPSSMVYTYAALMEDVPFANGAPNLSVDVPAMMALAQQKRLPICGKDFKTGQTWIKTVITPGEGPVAGRGGLVFDQHLLATCWMIQCSFKQKYRCSTTSSSRTSSASTKISSRHPDQHTAASRNKEGWDNIDRWAGSAQMQLKINSSAATLAAPSCWTRAMDLARRAGLEDSGVALVLLQSPMHAPGCIGTTCSFG